MQQYCVQLAVAGAFFVGFRYSNDLGKTWTQTPRTPDKPLFGEQSLDGEPVKIGSPHFVDFGKNMEHSPDGKAYLVAHGAPILASVQRPSTRRWMTVGLLSRNTSGNRCSRTLSKDCSMAKRLSDTGTPTAEKPGWPVAG